MVDLSPYMVTGTNDPTKQVSVTKWNALLTNLEGGETIYLKDNGIVADGVTVNSAAAVTAIIAALPAGQGNEIVFPLGTSVFDGRIVVTRPCRLRGYGCGTAGSGSNTASGSTLLLFPAGSTGFRFMHGSDGGAQGSELSDLRIAASAVKSNTGTGIFSTGTLKQISSVAGTPNLANNEVVILEGAGPSLLLADRTFTLANGATSGTWVHSDGQNRGNAIGYVGQVIDISGASLPANTTITAWGAGTFTVSAAATAAGAAGGGATATIKTPLVTEIQSGAGTATLVTDGEGQTGFAQNATGTVLRHGAAGIMSSAGNIRVRNVDIMGFQIGVFLHGLTNPYDVADNCSFYDCTINCTWAGAVFEGSDAQVNSFYSCNFAGCLVGVLDMSPLGNGFYGCHWAFNCGIMVPSAGAVTKLVGGYFETGTSYLAPVASACTFYGTTSIINGSGWNGIASGGGQLTLGHIEATGSAKLGLGSFLGGAGSGTSGYEIRFAPGSVNVSDLSLTGPYVKAINDGTRHWWFTSSGSDAWRLDGGPVELWHNAVQRLVTTTSGVNLPGSNVLQQAGVQVVGARGASLPADATDLATALTLVNAIKARLKTTGGHGLVAD